MTSYPQSTRNYYNDNDPYCAAWLRNLIAAKLIPVGDVDDRSIQQIKASEVRGYAQCHFFAGLGGWPRALALAQWQGPCWTGSCPCQPFSSAGKLNGFADERHVWPYWRGLIAQCRPPVIFGEQVASAKFWIDLVLASLEKLDYACGAAVLPAASVGARHQRDRFWFVGHAHGARLAIEQAHKPQQKGDATTAIKRTGSRLSDTERLRQLQSQRSKSAQRQRFSHSGWWDAEPDVGRVANGVPARVDKLRALGNAIVPQVAAEFIKAAREAI